MSRLLRTLLLLAALPLAGLLRAGVPLAALLAQGTVHGFTAEYFQGRDLTDHRVTRIDPQLDGAQTPPVGLSVRDGFSARWSAFYTAPYTESDYLYAYAGQGSPYSRIYTYVDGNLVAFQYGDEPWDSYANPVAFQAGHSYRLEIRILYDHYGPSEYYGEPVVATDQDGTIPSSRVTPAVVPQVAATPTLAAGPNKVTVSWPSVTGATGYNVYRRTPSGSVDYVNPVNGGTPVAQGGSPSLVDNSPAGSTTHGYTVKPVVANAVTGTGTLASPSTMGTLVEGPFVPDVVGDTDRNGVVNPLSDEVGKSVWTNARGAIFVANNNRDDNNARPSGYQNGITKTPDGVDFDDNGNAVAESLTVDGAYDYTDFATICVRAINPTRITRTRRVFLRFGNEAQAKAVHVFTSTNAGTQCFVGGPASTVTRVEITAKVTDYLDTYFYVERLYLRGQRIRLADGTSVVFDGKVTIRLEIEDDRGNTPSDSVEIRVAPFLMLPNGQSSQSLWTAKYNPPPSNPTYFQNNSVFLSGLATIFSSLQQVPLSSQNNQWFQDHAEIGYTQLPGQSPKWCALRLPYPETNAHTLPSWPNENFLSSTAGTFCLGRDLGAIGFSGDYGGDIEALPPTSTDPLGRILMGDRSSDSLQAFFQRQEAQPVTTVPTNWLYVGHLDEVIGIVGTNNQVAVADPVLAYSLLSGLSTEDRKRAVFFASAASNSEPPATPTRPPRPPARHAHPPATPTRPPRPPARNSAKSRLGSTAGSS